MVPADVAAAWGWQDAEIAVLPGGLINLTYVVRSGAPLAVLQRLHPVFGAKVNLDIEAVTAHLAARGLITPRLIRTRDGRAWVGHADIRNPDALTGWFYRVVVNHCLRLLRRRRLFSLFRPARDGDDSEDAAAEQASGALALDEEIGRALDGRRLCAAVDRLPAKQKAVVVLRFVHEITVEETAAMLSIGTETARTHLKRALARLRAELEHP